MSAWKAEIKPGSEGKTFDVAGLKTVAELGEETRLELKLLGCVPEGLGFGTRIDLEDEHSRRLYLETLSDGRRIIAPSDERWKGEWTVWAVRGSPLAGKPPARALFKQVRERVLWQRHGEEPAHKFVSRAIDAGFAFRDSTNKWLEKALPVHACLSAPAFFPAEARLARILAAAGARASRATAWFSPLSGKDPLCVVDDEPSQSVKSLGDNWGLKQASSRRKVVVQRIIDGDTDPDEIAQRLCFAGEPLGGEDDAPPVVPGLVEVGERFWFATRVETEIYFKNPDSPDSTPSGDTTLWLSDWSTFVAETHAPRSFAQVYLGKVVKTDTVGDWGVLHISPLEDSIFPPWSASGGLLAFEAVPAPTRNGQCALHVSRDVGDPVVFVVSDAGPPVVLGAPAGACDYDKGYGVHIHRNALFHGELHVGSG